MSALPLSAVVNRNELNPCAPQTAIPAGAYPRLARQTVWRQLPVRHPPQPIERERIEEEPERWDGMG